MGCTDLARNFLASLNYFTAGLMFGAKSKTMIGIALCTEWKGYPNITRNQAKSRLGISPVLEPCIFTH